MNTPTSSIDSARVRVVMERLDTKSGEVKENLYGRASFGEVRSMLGELKDTAIEFDDRAYLVSGARWRGDGDSLTVILELR